MNHLERSGEKNLLQFQSMLAEGMAQKVAEQTYSFTRLMSYYRCAIMEIETKFNVLNEEFSLQYDRQPISTIKSRLKTPASISEKLNRYHWEVSAESIEKNLNDVAGIRVICSFLDDVYMLADALLKQDDITLIACKDYIKNPKPNGYRSLHLIVSVPIFLQDEKRLMRAEVQLRTIAMDSWASLEHQLRYKKELAEDVEVERELQRCAMLSSELDETMDHLRKQLSTQQQNSETILMERVKKLMENLPKEAVSLGRKVLKEQLKENAGKGSKEID